MARPQSRGPKALGEILSDLYTLRGYAQLQASGELEEAWNEAVGEADREHTQVGQIRRGVLNVTVAHPSLLEELAAFRKAELLATLQQRLPDAGVQDIRFRIGLVNRHEKRGTQSESRGEAVSPPVPKPSNQQRSRLGNRRGRVQKDKEQDED